MSEQVTLDSFKRLAEKTMRRITTQIARSGPYTILTT